MPAPRFPADLIALQLDVWRTERHSYAWLLAGPPTPPGTWPLPAQREYQQLRTAVRSARRAVEDHPVVAGAIADGKWAATARALHAAAREGEDDEARARLGLTLTA